MIDIHCHILFGLDDGAKNLEESVQVARLAYADGIRHMIATPHHHAELRQDKNIILSKIAQLQEELNRQQIDITLYPGNEVRMDSIAFIEDQLATDGFHYLAGKRSFILLEQRWTDYEEETPRIVRELLEQGIRPIIPHPERHFFFREVPQRVLDLAEAGAWIQVNADSIIGNNGEEARQFAEWLADRELIHFVASDTHNMNRTPKLSQGFAVLEARIGKARADEIRTRAEQIIG